MANLIEPIKSIHDKARQLHEEKERKIKEIEDAYKKQIEELLIAKKELLKLNTACWECDGKGYVYIGSSHGYEDRASKEVCKECNGTGMKREG